MPPSPRVPTTGSNTNQHRVGAPLGGNTTRAWRTMSGGKPLNFVDGISRPQGRAAYTRPGRGQNRGSGVGMVGGEPGTAGYGNRAGAGGVGATTSSGYAGSAYGGGMGGMGGMYGMGMGMSMGMFPMMSGMLGNGLISRLYSLQYMVQSLTYMWHMASMNSHLLVQAYHDALKRYQDILMKIRTSEFRRVIQRKCKKSRLFQFLFVVASSALAAAAVKLIQYLLLSPRNDLLTMGTGMGLSGSSYYGRPALTGPIAAPNQPSALPVASASTVAQAAAAEAPPTTLTRENVNR